MKKIVFTFCFVLLFSLSAFCKEGNLKFEKIVKKHNLQSLVSSDWLKKNPQQLPFEVCRIDTYYGNFHTEHNVLNYGTYVQTEDPGSYLSCFSNKLKIAYRLPIQIGEMSNVGLYLDVASISLLNMSITVNNMEGKILNDLFKGSYKGRASNFEVLFGISSFNLKNEAGIQIRNVSLTEGLGISFGKASLILSHREGFYKKEFENNFIMMDVEKLSTYKFVKIN